MANTRRRARDDFNEQLHPRTPKGSSGGGRFSSGEGELPDAHETVVRGVARKLAQAMASRSSAGFSSREVAEATLSATERGFWGRLPGKTRVAMLKEETQKLLAEKPVSYRDAEDSWDESAHPRAPKGQGGGGQFVGGQTAGGIDQGEVNSNWHPDKDNAYVGRTVNEKDFGASYGATSEDDQAFLDNHGEGFLPVLNELSNEYDVDQTTVEEFMHEMGLAEDPQAVLTAFHQSYVGSFDDPEAAAEDFIHETYPRLPKAFTDTISRSDLSDNLFFNKGSPYLSIENTHGEYMIFKRPHAAAKDSLTEDDDEEVETRVIGVNDEHVVFDVGANVRRTADGYLVASPRIARTGIQVYRGWEMGVPDKDTVRIYRPEKEVFAPDSLRSYAHKPVTNNHPKEAVTADNWRKYAVGNTADEVLRDGGFIRMPIMISDANTIQDVEDGKVELSLGYTMELDMTPGETEDGQTYDGVQRKIRANHLAIVASARGGKELRVGDSTGDTTMTKKITVDGASFDVDDAAAVVIPRHVERLEKGVADAAIALKTAQDAAAAAAATIATLTAENTTLKKKVEDAKLTPAQIEQLVRDRALVVAQARAVLPTVVTDGRELTDIRRQVVDAAMGAASKGWNEEQVASSFAVLAKDSKVEANETRDGLSAALSNPIVSHNGQQALDAAYAEHDKKLTEAWRKPVAA